MNVASSALGAQCTSQSWPFCVDHAKSGEQGRCDDDNKYMMKDSCGGSLDGVYSDVILARYSGWKTSENQDFEVDPGQLFFRQRFNHKIQAATMQINFPGNFKVKYAIHSMGLRSRDCKCERWPKAALEWDGGHTILSLATSSTYKTYDLKPFNIKTAWMKFKPVKPADLAACDSCHFDPGALEIEFFSPDEVNAPSTPCPFNPTKIVAREMRSRGNPLVEVAVQRANDENEALLNALVGSHKNVTQRDAIVEGGCHDWNNYVLQDHSWQNVHVQSQKYKNKDISAAYRGQRPTVMTTGLPVKNYTALRFKDYKTGQWVVETSGENDDGLRSFLGFKLAATKVTARRAVSVSATDEVVADDCASFVQGIPQDELPNKGVPKSTVKDCIQAKWYSCAACSTHQVSCLPGQRMQCQVKKICGLAVSEDDFEKLEKEVPCMAQLCAQHCAGL